MANKKKKRNKGGVVELAEKDLDEVQGGTGGGGSNEFRFEDAAGSEEASAVELGEMKITFGAQDMKRSKK